MSRGPTELAYRVPDQPRLGGAVRASLVDFYFNSWRLVPANAVWGLGLIGLLILFALWPLAGVALLFLLALPVAGIFRLAVLIVRQQPVALSDAFAAWREFLRPALLAGVVVSVITVVLGTNMIVGFGTGQPLGWALGTAAGWGMLATWAVTLPFWPLLVDPVRAAVPMRDNVRLAATLVLASPARFGGLLLLVGLLFVASVILFAALLSITIAFIALLLAHVTLPAADRLEQRATQPVYE